MLRRCLLLVLLLDKAACDPAVLHDGTPLLFRLQPARGIKCSAEVTKPAAALGQDQNKGF